MKKTILLTVVALLTLLLGACGKSDTNGAATASPASPEHPVDISVGYVDLPPYGDIVKLVQENLKTQGINLQLKAFTDVTIPNQALNNKEIDVNYYQSLAYLEQFNKSNNMDLVPLSTSFTSIFGAYSKKYKTIDELPEGAVITIPADPGNSGRSLALLESYGLIKLKDGTGIHGSKQDIVENKKNYKIVEVDQMLLSQAYNDSDLTAMQGTYALKANLIPAKDAIIKEKYEGDDFLVVLAARVDNQNDVNIQTVAKAFASDEVKKLLGEKYSDSFKWKLK
ncbi:MetQ/NlpA family ABC transporter substrate-binding protein [Paenibacillus sp. GCM10012307]|uniref:MetQ/NlpA family ABC transporter substrate-binding protein n=1 Tax=Paenibacillus roseus TaxID=2798579 RepID=A0A934MRK7_9BACL|nr:MetQ/NlpA family ABC transporter substrate-binding protein [Paenibacillus roseus]MBJ6362439.1 MetQ/NlpA family ABC transporter substrate-binding protein [Paenibacillus roseus]